MQYDTGCLTKDQFLQMCSSIPLRRIPVVYTFLTRDPVALTSLKLLSQVDLYQLASRAPRFEREFERKFSVEWKPLIHGPIIMYRNDFLDWDLVKEKIQEALTKFYETNARSDMHQATETLVGEIKKIKDTVLQKIIWIVLFGFLVQFSAGYSIEKSRITSGTPKAFVSTALNGSDSMLVRVQTLNVREGPSKNARIIGHLQCGFTVKVIEKRESWSLVEWRSQSSDIMLRGWVYNRYLKNAP